MGVRFAVEPAQKGSEARAERGHQTKQMRSGNPPPKGPAVKTEMGGSGPAANGPPGTAPAAGRLEAPVLCGTCCWWWHRHLQLFLLSPISPNSSPVAEDKMPGSVVGFATVSARALGGADSLGSSRIWGG